MITQEFHPFGGEIQRPGIGTGLEAEQVYRAAKWQVMTFLPETTEELQQLWNARDREYAELTEAPFTELRIPDVARTNFYTGARPSLVEEPFPLEKWTNVTFYCGNTKPNISQPDDWDTSDIELHVIVMCNSSQVLQENLHNKEGMEAVAEVDSKLQRLSDAVHSCIKRDPTLGNVLSGQIEKPPMTTTTFPWARSQEKGTGNFYVFQGKELKYIVQKNSF